MPFALLLLSAGVAAIAVVSLRAQFRNWRRLRSESLASDDRRYLRGICQRRALNSILLLLLAGLLAGAFFSGGLQQLGDLAGKKQADLTDEDKEAFRGLVYYWIGILGLLFVVMLIAIADYASTSLYGREQYRRIQKEQRELLERDLAVYRQQKLNDRMKRLQ
jgi:hypothetical protein